MPRDADDEPAGAPSPESSGPDLVREALDRARADAAARRGELARAERADASAQARGRRRAGRGRLVRGSGDPVTFGSVLKGFVDERGWDREVAAGTVMGNWAVLVGPEIARHAAPVSLNAGVLTVQAESTAWATQLRALGGQLLQRLQAGAGADVVTKLVVRGPTAPTWSHGSRRVRGEGPRDTYG